ncbi:MAG TPA: hypothetical protein VMB82_10355, partial [Acidimicrobiales bacterium]|nr:hypothetical protein [Acidimicrobiales bacterium]
MHGVGAPLLAGMALIGLAGACSAPPHTGGNAPSPPVSSTTGHGTATTVPSSEVPAGGTGASPTLLAVGTPVPSSAVGPLSFVSPSQGFGLDESVQGSTAQQLVETGDSGATWRVATAGTLPTWASVLDFTGPDDGYAWGGQGLDVTHDGGRRWTMTLRLSPGDQTVSPIGESVWAVSSSGALVTSVDGGTTWERDSAAPSAAVGLLSRVSASVAYLMGCGPIAPNGSETGTLARTEDGGRTWRVLPLPMGCAGAESSDVVALSSQDLWLVQFGQPATDMTSKWVYRSYDGGEDWHLQAREDDGPPYQDVGTIGPIGDAGPLDVLAAAPDRAWLAEDRGGLLVTTDGGRTWSGAFADEAAGAFGPPFVSFLDADHG